MGKTSVAILVGLSLGIVAAVLYQRLEEQRRQPDPDSLADRLAEKLKALEGASEKVG